MAARPKNEPRELRGYFGLRTLCESLPPPVKTAGGQQEIASAQICSQMARRGDEVRKKFPEEMALHDAGK